MLKCSYAHMLKCSNVQMSNIKSFDPSYGHLDEESTFYTLLLIDPICLYDVLLFSLGVAYHLLSFFQNYTSPLSLI